MTDKNFDQAVSAITEVENLGAKIYYENKAILTETMKNDIDQLVQACHSIIEDLIHWKVEGKTVPNEIKI